MTSIETNVATLDEACRVLFEGTDADRCREARRFVCRADASVEAVDRIVALGARDDWSDEQEEAAYQAASAVLFGDGFPQTPEEFAALMAGGEG